MSADLRTVWDEVGQPWQPRMTNTSGGICLQVQGPVLQFWYPPKASVPAKGRAGGFIDAADTLPDLSDAMNRGALLNKVREATGDPYVYVARDADFDVWHVYSSEQREPLAEHADEGMALLLALRVALGDR